MDHFWNNGPLFVRDLRKLYPEPKPHFNTLSGQVRTLEADGFIGHVSYGPVYQYHAIITRDEYNSSVLTGVVNKLFGSSYLSAVSSLIREEKITVEDLRELISKIEQ